MSQVKIGGVLHKSSSTPGVKEDVTEVITNIKDLAIKNSSDTDGPKVTYTGFEGEGVITAADIQTDADIKIMNPDRTIITLSGGTDSKFYTEFTTTKGRDYISANKNRNDDLPVGVIVVDSIYTLVERVSVAIADTRVGQ